MRFKLTVILSFIINLGFSQDYETLWQDGNSAYEQQNYELALDLYDSIERQNIFSNELYLNLGNTYFRLNQLGNAILYYEKALKLNPKDEDILHNLSFCNGLITDKVEDIKSSPVNDLLFKNGNQNVYAYIVCILLFLLFALILIYTLQTYNKKVFLSSTTIITMLSIVFLLLALQQEKVLNNTNEGIIITSVANIKIEPKTNSNDAFVLHEGSKVEIIEIQNNWTKIMFDKKNIGWIKNSKFEII